MTDIEESLAKTETIFRPKYRVFLSVDLVGSTAFKQTAEHGFMDNSSLSGTEFQPWLSPIANFYAAFSLIFEEYWKHFETSIKNVKWPVGPRPELWKANGDELIFVKEVIDRREVKALIKCWVDVVNHYRRELFNKTRLDVKATCWGAGFPVLNSEIIIHAGDRSNGNNRVGDVRVRQFELLKQWYGDSKTARVGLVRDFLGPSIDTGFRLAQLATPRKMPISVEIAWFLASADKPLQMEDREAFHLPPIYYDGGKSMRGVLSGKPYPLFWIDMKSDDKIAIAENDLIAGMEPCGEEKIDAFCQAFFRDEGNHIFEPFIVNEPPDKRGKIPARYFEILLALQDIAKKEKKKDAEIVKALEGSRKPGRHSHNELNESEIDEIIKQMLKKN